MSRIVAFWGLLLLTLAGGCAARPIQAWQKSLESYVVDKGNGDLNVLRKTDLRPSEGDHSLIEASKGGIPFLGPTRTDANCVLLGLKQHDGRSWFVFLVGAVKYRGAFVNFPLDDPQVTDIRLAAVSGDDGRFSWRVGLPDLEALQRYCEPQLEAWRRSHPSRAGSVEGPTTFPTPKDNFELTTGSATLIAVDGSSRARWTLELTEPE